jgi:hypothetical protein
VSPAAAPKQPLPQFPPVPAAARLGFDVVATPEGVEVAVDLDERWDAGAVDSVPGVSALLCDAATGGAVARHDPTRFISTALLSLDMIASLRDGGLRAIATTPMISGTGPRDAPGRVGSTPLRSPQPRGADRIDHRRPIATSSTPPRPPPPWGTADHTGGPLHDIVSPPETESVWPVTYPAPGESRKATAGAMSWGVPIRRIGTARARPS